MSFDPEPSSILTPAVLDILYVITGQQLNEIVSCIHVRFTLERDSVYTQVTDDGNVVLDNFIPYLQPGHKIGKVKSHRT